MNDKLQDTLATLADGLGVSVNQLWDWLQGKGIESYTKVVINQLIFVIIAGIILFCISSVLCYKFYKLYLVKKDECFGDSDTPFFGFIFSGAIGVVILAIILVSSHELIGWLSSPEGMIIKLFLNKF